MHGPPTLVTHYMDGICICPIVPHRSTFRTSVASIPGTQAQAGTYSAIIPCRHVGGPGLQQLPFGGHTLRLGSGPREAFATEPGDALAVGAARTELSHSGEQNQCKSHRCEFSYPFYRDWTTQCSAWPNWPTASH